MQGDDRYYRLPSIECIIGPVATRTSDKASVVSAFHNLVANRLADLSEGPT